MTTKPKGVFFEVPPELRARFKDACRAKGLVEAQVFRAFMAKFIERYGEIERSEAVGYGEGLDVPPNPQ